MEKIELLTLFLTVFGVILGFVLGCVVILFKRYRQLNRELLDMHRRYVGFTSEVNNDLRSMCSEFKAIDSKVSKIHDVVCNR